MSEPTRDLPWMQRDKKPQPEPPEKLPTIWANRICARCRQKFYLGPHDTEAEMNPILAICPVCDPDSYPDRGPTRAGGNDQ